MLPRFACAARVIPLTAFALHAATRGDDKGALTQAQAQLAGLASLNRYIARNGGMQ